MNQGRYADLDPRMILRKKLRNEISMTILWHEPDIFTQINKGGIRVQGHRSFLWSVDHSIHDPVSLRTWLYVTDQQGSWYIMSDLITYQLARRAIKGRREPWSRRSEPTNIITQQSNPDNLGERQSLIRLADYSYRDILHPPSGVTTEACLARKNMVCFYLLSFQQKEWDSGDIERQYWVLIVVSESNKHVVIRFSVQVSFV